MTHIYFDNAASTPLLKEVKETFLEGLEKGLGNASSVHHHGRISKNMVEDARRTIAQALNASIGEIFFTSGGTESNNMAIKNAIRQFGIQRIISSPIEHPCVLNSIKNIDKKVEKLFLNVDKEGFVDILQLEALLKENKPTLVSIMHANNELGTLQDIQSIGEICQEYGAYFHSDTVQTVAHYPIDLQKIPVHFISGSAHKFHGPKGIGFVYINNNAIISPYIHGGAQERNMRAGTENVAGIVAMAKAFELAHQTMEEDHKYILSLKNHFTNQIREYIPTIEINGPKDFSKALYTVLNLKFPKSSKTDMLNMYLDMKNISASAGSACSSGSEKSSHVLEAISAPDDDRTSVRFSFSKLNTIQEIDQVVDVLKEALKS